VIISAFKKGGIMRNKISIFAAFLVTLGFLTLILSPSLLNGKSLKEHYQTGALLLEEQLRIGIDSVPDDVAFKYIGDFIFTKNGNVFISDMGTHSLKMFDSQGRFIKVVGQKGAGPGDLASPSTLGYNGENVFVWEIRNQRFSFFSEKGEYIKSVKPKKQLMVKKIRALNNGDVIIETEKYNYGQNIGQECILGLYSKDLEFKKDIYRHPVLTNKFITKPMRINIPQPFQPLVSWDIVKNGKIIIGFQEKYEIGIYDIEGKKTASFTHEYQPVKITEKDKKEFFDSITFTNGNKISRGAPKYMRDNTTFPKYKPVFEHIVVDYEGNILVFPSISTTSKDKKITYFDAFDPQGKFIKKAAVDSKKLSFYYILFHKGHVWTVIQDEDEESILVKYKIVSK
jgi:hypothetical protein